MILSIFIIAIQQLTFLTYLFESAFFTRTASEESRALMFAVALFSMILSLPSVIWNYSMVKDYKRKSDIVPFYISIFTLAFGVVYLVTAFVIRVHRIGFTVF